jgi:hypothetical protein
VAGPSSCRLGLRRVGIIARRRFVKTGRRWPQTRAAQRIASPRSTERRTPISPIPPIKPIKPKEQLFSSVEICEIGEI